MINENETPIARKKKKKPTRLITEEDQEDVNQIKVFKSPSSIARLNRIETTDENIEG
jgi:hypothetical protein